MSEEVGLGFVPGERISHHEFGAGVVLDPARDGYLQAPVTLPTFSAEERLDLFARAVEPTLQRELKHKGAANGDGSYSAELIGYVEIDRQVACCRQQ